MTSQHVVIVGGSSGIGLASARKLLASGLSVTITGRDEIRLVAAKRALPGVRVMRMDAAEFDTLPALFAEIGPIDHLVLALGSRKGLGPFASVSVAEVRQGFEQKVVPQFATAQAALPHMNRSGSITFLAAVSAHAASPGTAGIGAQNAAVVALVPILANELKPLRVNGVSPGLIDTPFWDFLQEDQRSQVYAEYAGKTPVGRVGRAEDIAQAIAFLIENTFMTGHVVVCDGGLRLAA